MTMLCKSNNGEYILDSLPRVLYVSEQDPIMAMASAKSQDQVAMHHGNRTTHPLRHSPVSVKRSDPAL